MPPSRERGSSALARAAGPAEQRRAAAGRHGHTRAGRLGRHAHQGDSPAVRVTGPSPDRGTRWAGGPRSVDRLVDGGPEVVPHGQLLVAGV
jgi:hypothetical protein